MLFLTLIILLLLMASIVLLLLDIEDYTKLNMLNNQPGYNLKEKINVKRLEIIKRSIIIFCTFITIGILFVLSV